MLEQQEYSPIQDQMEELTEEQAWQKEWEQALQEEAETRKEEDPVTRDYELRSFISTSRGVGRKCKPRDVQLVRNRQNGKSVLLKDIPTKGLDVIADELLKDKIPADQDTFVEFVRRLES